MPSTTKRHAILTALVTALKAIDGTGDYNTDLSNRVYLRRQAPLAPTELPAIIVIDPGDNPSSEQVHSTTNLSRWDLNVQVQARVAPASIEAETIDLLIGDIYKAIGADDTFSGNVIRTQLNGDSLIFEQEENLIIGAAVNVALLYQVNKYAGT